MLSGTEAGFESKHIRKEDKNLSSLLHGSKPNYFSKIWVHLHDYQYIRLWD